MNMRAILPLALVSVLGVTTAAWPAPPTNAAGLSPCAFAANEIKAVFGIVVETTNAADMSLSDGRDVGCFYTVKGSSFTLAVRQIWKNSRSSTPAPAKAAKGMRATALPGDPDGAVVQMQETDEPGAGAELVYVRGKVETHIVVKGGRLTGEEVRQLFPKLRRVP